MSTDTAKAAEVLAELLVSGERDWFESLSALRPVLSDPMWVALCERLDLCPTHFCDDYICREDRDTTCAAGREAAAEETTFHQNRSGRFGL